MRPSLRLASGAIYAAALLGACSDSSDRGPTGAPPTPTDHAGNDANSPTVDAADAASNDGATPPMQPFPVAATSGGPVVATPKIAVVTFAGDALEPSIAAFNESPSRHRSWQRRAFQRPALCLGSSLRLARA